jgi:hypothetical protein
MHGGRVVGSANLRSELRGLPGKLEPDKKKEKTLIAGWGRGRKRVEETRRFILIAVS